MPTEWPDAELGARRMGMGYAASSGGDGVLVLLDGGSCDEDGGGIGVTNVETGTGGAESGRILTISR